MDIPGIRKAVKAGRIQWNRHALERIMERGIKRSVVKRLLLKGKVIEDYPDDQPYPSALFLGYAEREPLHVVAAFDPKSQYCFVITVYRPDLEHFEPDYKTRRSP